MEVLTSASVIALGMTFISFLKYLRAKDFNAAITQVMVWISGVVMTFLASAADVTNTLNLPGGIVLSDVNGPSKVLLGMMLLSTGSVVYNFKKAIDGRDTAREPSLLPFLDNSIHNP